MKIGFEFLICLLNHTLKWSLHTKIQRKLTLPLVFPWKIFILVVRNSHYNFSLRSLRCLQLLLLALHACKFISTRAQDIFTMDGKVSSFTQYWRGLWEDKSQTCQSIVFYLEAIKPAAVLCLLIRIRWKGAPLRHCEHGYIKKCLLWVLGISFAFCCGRDRTSLLQIYLLKPFFSWLKTFAFTLQVASKNSRFLGKGKLPVPSVKIWLNNFYEYCDELM